MRARCAQCQFIFPVEGDGIQVCPNCGAELDLALPQRAAPDPLPSAGTPAPQHGSAESFVPPPPGGEPAFFLPASAQEKVPTPWERRAEIGFFKGLIDTVMLSVKNPVGFFSSMPANNANGALTYYWILGGVSVAVSSLWTMLISILSGDTADKLSQLQALAQMVGQMEASSSAFFEAMLPILSVAANPGATLLCQLLSALVFTPIQLLIAAGIYHLSALVLGAAHNGFNATLRAFGYAAGPLLLSVIPLCGAAIGGLAWSAFAIIGLARLQEVSYGKAVLVYLLPMLFFCACACAASFALFGLSVGGMASQL